LKKDALFGEIRGSRESLEKMPGAPVLSFAFPYGKLNRKVKRLVGEAGYKRSCAVYTKPEHFETDPFQIRRVQVKQSNGVTKLIREITLPPTMSASLKRRYRSSLDSLGLTS